MAVIEMVRIVGVTLGLLCLLGWLPWAAIGPVRRRVNGWFAAPFFGLTVIEVFGWYWLEWGQGGMRTGVMVLGAVWLVGVVFVVLWPRRGDVDLLPSASRRGLLGVGIVAMGALVLSSLIMINGLRGNEPVPTWYGNADLAHYALVSQNYVDHGHEHAGSITTGDLGEFGRDDAAGVRSFLAAMAIVNGTDVATVIVPAIAVALVLLALASAWVLGMLTRAGPILVAGMALLVLIPFCLTYIAGQGYLAQALAMASTVAFTAILLGGDYSSWKDALLVSVPAALVMTSVLLSYPHMAAGSFVVVGLIATLVRIDSVRIRDWPVEALRMTRVVLPVAFAAVISALAVAPVIGGLVDRADRIATANAGWALALMTPLEVLGLLPFRGMVDSTRLITFSNVDMTMPSASQWFGQALAVIIILGVGSLVAWRHMRRLALFPVVTGLVVLVSQRLLFAERGISYQQWKWTTFFQPLLTIAVLVAVAALVRFLFSEYPARRSLTIALTTAGVTLLLFVSVRLDVRMWSQDWPVVTEDIAQLAELRNSGLDHINILVEPYARSMWAALYVAPLRTNLLSGSYFPTSDDRSGWTVAESRYVSGRPAQVIPLNSTFTLVCFQEPCGPAPALPGRR